MLGGFRRYIYVHKGAGECGLIEGIAEFGIINTEVSWEYYLLSNGKWANNLC